MILQIWRDVKQQRRQYAKRQAEKFERLSACSLDPENKKRYKAKYESWEQEVKKYSVTDDVRERRKDTPQRMIELVDKYTMDEFVMIDESADGAFAYDPELDAVVVNPSHPMYSSYNYREIMIHEIAHRIDQNIFGSPMHLQFSEAISMAEKRLIGNVQYYQKMFEPGGELEYNYLVSDMLGCITDNTIVGASYHDSQYIGIPGYAELEIFADMFSALYQSDDETVSFIKKELPEVYKAFLGILGE